MSDERQLDRAVSEIAAAERVLRPMKRKLVKRKMRRKKPLSDAEKILLTIQAVVTTALAAIKVLKPQIKRMKAKTRAARRGHK